MIKFLMTIFTCTVYIIFNNIYAGARYKLQITNNTNYDVYVMSDSDWCIENNANTIRGGGIVKTNSSVTFGFNDSNNNNCNDAQKHIVIRVFPLINGSNKYDSINQENDSFFTFVHQKNNGNWSNLIQPVRMVGNFSGAYDMNTNSYPSADYLTYVSSATCRGKDCLNKWSDDKDDMDLNITLKTSYKFQPVGLGDMTVTDGYGNILTPLVGTDLNSPRPARYSGLDKYILRFTRTTKQCVVSDNILTCDSTIGYISRNYLSYNINNVVLTCQQTQSGDPQCPWISLKNASNTPASIY
ncbi:hypothetical protein L3V83_02365 [Thiotrichales bacterium 19X7-9]|nr:hypothetical protein [Thiotrichales bacterium 19X7-9]